MTRTRFDLGEIANRGADWYARRPIPDRLIEAFKRIDYGILTPAELRVMKLVANGLSSKQISELLYVSIHTVYSQRKSAIKRLGAVDITHAVAKAFALGLIKKEDIG